MYTVFVYLRIRHQSTYNASQVAFAQRRKAPLSEAGSIDATSTAPAGGAWIDAEPAPNKLLTRSTAAAQDGRSQ
ncbi:MAG TPA: hypothetical protein PKC97_13375 [Burkholderiaceae bacterium]|nr:hypothetical protein [Burkholderiaceae bacterium]